MPKLTKGKFSSRKLLEANIVRLYRLGHTMTEVADRCMVTQPTVSHILRRLKLQEEGVKVPDSRQSLNQYRNKIMARHAAINSWRAPPLSNTGYYVSNMTVVKLK
jgi:transposase